MLRCDVLTLFPDLVQLVLDQSMLKQVPGKMLIEAF
jgi:tRNA G37 N-methylase TrmD